MPADVPIAMIAAGSHHSVALTTEGDVLTWGAHIVMFILLELASGFNFFKCIAVIFRKGSWRGRPQILTWLLLQLR